MGAKLSLVLLISLLFTRLHGAAAAPTWPSSVDELEDIMFLNTGYRARGFATAVTPCSFSAQGPGRIAAAEWIRTAFHDMATGNVFQGTGGLDASLVFELGGDNVGPAFETTLTTYAPFLTSRSSMSDIIAMGIYTAVRSCGGPVVPIKTGRIDAIEAGPPGVPQPQNSLFTFQNQFQRTGFDTSQMIAVTACGHTVGGVHAANFPQIVPPGSAPNDYKLMDSTTKFDEKIASEYVAGKSTDPLTVGPAQAAGKASDLRVFSADGNATISKLADPATFASTCQAMLQKMIEVVPSSTTLTDPIAAYDVKPAALQLTLQPGGSQLQFSGEIRVRTTSRPASQISTVQLVYKDRAGGSDCGGCKISATQKGTAAGFDDSFTFYAFSAQIPSQSSISAFNVVITLASGATETYNNNDQGYPMQDNVILQAPQSCVAGGKTLTVTAAVRSPATSANLVLTLKVPRSGIITPELQTQTVAMTQKSTLGPYSIVTGTYTLQSDQVQTTKFDITSGQSSDASARVLTGKSTTSSTMNYKTCAGYCSGYTYWGVEFGSQCYCGNSFMNPTSSVPASDCSTKCSGDTTQVCGAGNRMNLFKSNQQSPTNATVPGWTYSGCYTDSTSARVLTGKANYDGALTIEKCATLCKGFKIFGAEYATQCYCGNAFANATTKVGEGDCGYTCAGNALQLCGAGNRLSVYKANI
ncbi:MAG: hypothetical protein L6R37_004233 [Teloschistes peruensis]|nr:MAG: hypothetical protein L6R37_004233 [Teloschistes peruensis]